MNSLRTTILLLFSAIALQAQQLLPKGNLNFGEVLELKNSLLTSSNPAAIHYNTIDTISIAEIDYSLSDGNYKAAMSAKQSHQAKLFTESYRRFKKTMLYGAFTFAKEWHWEQNYTNNYSPYRGTPYLFGDSIGGDLTDKEQDQLHAKVAHNFDEKIILGAEADYKVGLASQNRDPRAKNKVTSLHTNIGLMTNGKNIKVGINGFYDYYNEDIDINIVRENTFHSLLSMKGLGVFEGHQSTTFARLYKANSYGGAAQLKTYGNILEVGIKNSKEMVYDGRANNNATWSAIKTDSELGSGELFINDVYTITIDKFIHRIFLNAKLSKYAGTEYLQELVKIDDKYDTYQWKTIFEEKKYLKQMNEIALGYTFAKFYSENVRNYSINAEIKYNSLDEKYNYMNSGLNYSNMNFNIKGSKLIRLKQHRIDCHTNISYRYNLQNSYNSKVANFATKNITLPDFKYNTADFLQAGIGLDYTYTGAKKLSYFASINYASQYAFNYHIDNNRRNFCNVKIGVLF